MHHPDMICYVKGCLLLLFVVFNYYYSFIFLEAIFNSQPSFREFILILFHFSATDLYTKIQSLCQIIKYINQQRGKHSFKFSFQI